MRIFKLRGLFLASLFLINIAGCNYNNDNTEAPVNGSAEELAPAGENLSDLTDNHVPVARLTVSTTSGTAPLEVSLNARGSYDPDEDEISYYWNLGDGNNQEGWSTTHRYAEAGDYTVRLKVKDSGGRTSSVKQIISVIPPVSSSRTVNESPVAKMLLDPDTAPANVVSVSARGSYDPEGTSLSYQWKMGDGSTYDRWAVDHVYEEPGSYNIRLTVRDADGKTASTSEQVVIAPASTQPAVNPVVTSHPPATLQTSNSPLGTNVTAIRDWITSQPFVDLLRSARSFRKENGSGISYDANGWPKNLNGKVAITYVVTTMPDGAIPTGQYTVLYDGTGLIEFNYGKVLEESPGRKVLEFTDFSNTLILRILESDPSDHIRNIRILMPGGICADNPTSRVVNASACINGNYLDFETHHERIIFNPDYLRFMQNFSVLRYMDFMDTNHSKVRNWSDMLRFEAATWGTDLEGKSGGPIEIMVELANQLNANPWFTLPHLANDDYVRKFANYVRDNLKPGLKAYVEYSNEVWNGMFSQADYARQQGTAQNLDSNPNYAQLKYYTKRSVQIFKIWENSFGGTDRLVRVLASQSTMPSKSEIILAYDEAYRFTDALAIAPYFGGDTEPLRGLDNLNALFGKLKSSNYSRSLPQIKIDLQAQKTISDKYGVDLIAYEGGQHLADWATTQDDQYPNPLFYQANRDARMKDLYRTLLQNWKMAGGKLFVLYSAPHTWNKFGSWGLKEHLNASDQTPKYKAVTQFIRNNPQWW